MKVEVGSLNDSTIQYFEFIWIIVLAQLLKVVESNKILQ